MQTSTPLLPASCVCVASMLTPWFYEGGKENGHRAVMVIYLILIGLLLLPITPIICFTSGFLKGLCVYVCAVDGMFYSRRNVHLFALGLLFGYIMTFLIFKSLSIPSKVSHYSVPSSPYLHANMDLNLPTLFDVQNWQDFSEITHIGMSVFLFSCIEIWVIEFDHYA